jgi:GTP cyclohydrolase II
MECMVATPATTGEATIPDNAFVSVSSRARLPTRYGDFEIVAFENRQRRRIDDIAVVRGDIKGLDVVPVRLHSECLTGDVLGSLRCDCGEQLDLAMQRLGQAQCGVLLYMRQEGRGIGIANKVEAYALQDEGMDTVEANLHLGFDDDLRSYGLAACMLRALGVMRIELHTNNPAKVEGLRSAGIDVASRAPLIVTARSENRSYLETKKRRSGHVL